MAVAVTLFAAHESRDDIATRQIDFPGIAALTIGLTALVLALVEGNAWGWTSAGIVALLVTAVVGLTASSRSSVALRADRGLHVFRSRSFFSGSDRPISPLSQHTQRAGPERPALWCGYAVVAYSPESYWKRNT